MKVSDGTEREPLPTEAGLGPISKACSRWPTEIFSSTIKFLAAPFSKPLMLQAEQSRGGEQLDLQETSTKVCVAIKAHWISDTSVWMQLNSHTENRIIMGWFSKVGSVFNELTRKPVSCVLRSGQENAQERKETSESLHASKRRKYYKRKMFTDPNPQENNRRTTPVQKPGVFKLLYQSFFFPILRPAEVYPRGEPERAEESWSAQGEDRSARGRRETGRRGSRIFSGDSTARWNRQERARDDRRKK